jgi:hypothetical protein
VPEILLGRRMLLASAATLPLLVAVGGCRSSDAFAGPDPLAGPPRPAPEVVTLEAVITAEEDLIALYRAAIDQAATARAGMLRSLLAEHNQHLVQLRDRLILPPAKAWGQALAEGSGGSVPPGQALAGGSGGVVPPGQQSPAARPAPSPRGAVTTSRLRAAERASAAGLVGRLAGVEPALAQLFASIAASDATHVSALGGAP